MPQKSAPTTPEAIKALEALSALLEIPDLHHRARALTEVIRELPQRQRSLSDRRQADVRRMLAEPRASLRSVGALLSLSFSTVQDIANGYRGSGADRARAKRTAQG